jgi:hypothetical protein
MLDSYSKTAGECAEIRALISSVTEVPRQIAGACDDTETLFLLDVLNGDSGNSTRALRFAVLISAHLATKQGESEGEWLQCLLKRNAGNESFSTILWPMLIELRRCEDWPWAHPRTALDQEDGYAGTLVEMTPKHANASSGGGPKSPDRS